MRKRLSVYTKLSRFNVVLSFEQYKELLRRKAYAKKYDERMRYKDLVQRWGIAQHHMCSAVYRGIKQYDERIKEEEHVNNIRRQITSGRMERRNESRAVGLRPNAAATDKSSLGEYPQSRVIRGGYSDFIRANYFED